MSRPSRRDWQRAIRAELAYTSSPRDRAVLIVSALRVALVPPPGLGRALAGCGRAALFASGATVIVWLPLGAAMYLDNVVFPSSAVSPVTVLTTDVYLIAALMATGVAARRGCARPAALVTAGFAAGVVVAALTGTLFLIIDTVVPKLASGSAAVAAPGITVMAPIGAVLAPIGATLARRRAARNDAL